VFAVNARVIGLIAIGLLPGACRHNAGAKQSASPAVEKPARDTTRLAVFADTVRPVQSTRAREFDLRRPAARDSLRALLKKERAAWRTQNVRNYRFLGRIACFCPGQQGWLLLEVANGQLVRAANAAGKAVPISDWSAFTLDKLFDNLETWPDRDGSVAIAFDARWHFPTFVSTSRRMPDTWSTTEVRGFTSVRPTGPR
jgi:hypothetical protein